MAEVPFQALPAGTVVAVAAIVMAGVSAAVTAGAAAVVAAGVETEVAAAAAAVAPHHRRLSLGSWRLPSSIIKMDGCGGWAPRRHLLTAAAARQTTPWGEILTSPVTSPVAAATATAAAAGAAAWR